MDEDIEFDPSFQFFPGVDLTLWITIITGVVVCALIAAAAVFVV
jgi:hypothetical protein